MSDTSVAVERRSMREHVPLAPFTTWRIGGPAEWFVEPNNEEELAAALRFAQERDVPFAVIGRGSNLLVDDAGFPGVIACLRGRMDFIHVDRSSAEIRAGAGALMPTVAVAAERHGIQDFAFLVGIPGTIGGGIAINAGTGGHEGPSLKDVVVSVRLLDARSGAFLEVPQKELHLSYRHSNIPEGRQWVVGALMRGRHAADLDALVQQRKRIQEKRMNEQPINRRTTGSVFKRPASGVPAGRLIEEAGLKGLRIGGAAVSSKHANWIENVSDASSADVRALIHRIQEQVFTQSGTKLEREVRFLPDDAFSRTQ